MAKISIPPSVRAGFDQIASLNKGQINKVTEYLQRMPISGQMEDFENFMSDELKIDSPKQIVKTIASFTELLEDKNIVHEELAKDLTSSFIELSQGEIEVDVKTLQENLFEIFKHSKNLKLIIKTRMLWSENDNLLSKSRVLTDIRIVFGEELEESPRNAIVVHHLKLEYRNLGVPKKMSFCLDLQDLRELKEEIERAIAKEEIIKKDYTDNFEFINV